MLKGKSDENDAHFVQCDKRNKVFGIFSMKSLATGVNYTFNPSNNNNTAILNDIINHTSLALKLTNYFV